MVSGLYSMDTWKVPNQESFEMDISCHYTFTSYLKYNLNEKYQCKKLKISKIKFKIKINVT